MSDPGGPFQQWDFAHPGTENWPHERLICGYPTGASYIVEYEHGGLIHSSEKMKFRKSAQGFVRK